MFEDKNLLTNIDYAKLIERQASEVSIVPFPKQEKGTKIKVKNKPYQSQGFKALKIGKK